jgi:hypothetical protein
VIELREELEKEKFDGLMRGGLKSWMRNLP